MTGADVGLYPLVQRLTGLEGIHNELPYGGDVSQRSARQPTMGAQRLLPQEVHSRMILRVSTRGGLEWLRHSVTDLDVALWGLITGEAPDEIVVDVDEERDVLVVHLTDAGDPDAVRARHRAALERHRRNEVI